MFILSTHEHDENMRPDSEFIKGDLSFLVKGNKCRLLDGRRTTGFIESYDYESAMFRWRITKYEDKGKYWDMPAEKINRFQFEKDAAQLNKVEIQNVKEMIQGFDKKLEVKA